MTKKSKPTHFNTEQIRHEDNDHWLHPWESLRDIGQANRPIIEHADGIYVYDEQGDKLLDCSAGMWCVQIGYGRQAMADAIATQVKRLPYMSPFSLTSEPSARLAKKLAELAPADLTHVFFTTDGSTAVDSALRVVHIYNNPLNRPHKKHIIIQGNAYHGSTYLCGLVTSRFIEKSWFDVSSPFVHTLSSIADRYRNPPMNTQDFCAAAVLEFKNKILELGPENVGCFIAEPIQASGGVIIPPDSYLRHCWELCRQNDIIYISDEIVTGFGRLGHWFASKDVFDIEPDIITCAKGLSSGYLPIGAMLLSDKILQKMGHEHARNALFSQGFTYSGHPVCCAAALKNIEIFEQENLLQHVRDISSYFQAKLHELRTISMVSETRGMGLLGAVECHINVRCKKDEMLAWYAKLGKCIMRHAHELGLLLRFVDNTVVLSPPLTITKEEIDELFTGLHRSLELAMHEMESELKESHHTK